MVIVMFKVVIDKEELDRVKKEIMDDIAMEIQ